MEEEIYYRLALYFNPGIGNHQIKRLIHLFGDARSVFAKDAPLYAQSKGWKRTIPFPHITSSIDHLVCNELKMIEKHHLGISFFTDDTYPKRLLNCKDAPSLFFYKGADNFNSEKSISIVGTRCAGTYGKDVVRKIISELQVDNIVIISGLALGIDTEVHENALNNQIKTIGIMGSGFGTIYPPTNTKLAQRIISEKGTLISEYSYTTLPDRGNFPKRNRIIAGMSDAVLVAETGIKGGSIITAYIGHSYNRDIFAIPGSIFDQTQDGCHQLIRKNIAAIASSGQDIIELMGWDLQPAYAIQHQLFYEFTEEEDYIIEIIKQLSNPSIDEIIANASKLTPSKTTSILLGLELNGVLECKPGKVYRLYPKR